MTTPSAVPDIARKPDLEPDPNWPAWYAHYMAREQTGAELPT